MKDKEKKKIYDTYGEEGLQNGAGPSGNTRTFHYNTDPRATFEEFFGGENFSKFLKLLDEMCFWNQLYLSYELSDNKAVLFLLNILVHNIFTQNYISKVTKNLVNINYFICLYSFSLNKVATHSGNSGKLRNFQVEENLTETRGILICFLNSGKFWFFPKI